MLVYLGVTIPGCAFIAFAKLAGASPWLMIIVPPLFMVGYFVLTKVLRRIQLHDEQTGDNLYYMGFLFTLTSLGVALFQFSSDRSMDEIVQNFGVAISSTMFGIIGRIAYNQSRRDVLDIERAARQNLSEAANKVRTDMDLARREFTEFRRINQQMINEGFNDVIKHTEKSATKMMETLENLATEAAKPIETAAASMGSTLTDTVKDISLKLGNMSSMLDNSASKIQTTAQRINDIQLPSEILQNDLVPVVERIGNVVVDLVTRMDEMRNDQNKMIVALNNKIEETRKEQNEATKNVTEGVTKLVGDMKLSVLHLERLIQQSEKTVQASQQVAQQVAKTNEDVSKATAQSAATVQQMATKVDQQLQRVEKQGSELRDFVSKFLGILRPPQASQNTNSTASNAAQTAATQPVAQAPASTPSPATATTPSAPSATVSQPNAPLSAKELSAQLAETKARGEAVFGDSASAATVTVGSTSTSFEQVPFTPDGDNEADQPKVAAGGWTAA